MADKFFFKGRQDTRVNHVKSGYATNANIKAGTKDHPLNLTVTNEARQTEVALQVSEAELFANITLDKNEGAVESINELTILLNKTETVVLGDVPGRNDPCSCGSAKKYKKCCG